MIRSTALIFLLVLMISGCNAPYEQGRILYEVNCGNCHMNDGSGLGQAIPALKRESILEKGSEIACLIRHGQFRDGTMVMTANKSLSETEITNIINYIRYAFAEAGTFVKPADVGRALSSCKD